MTFGHGDNVTFKSKFSVTAAAAHDVTDGSHDVIENDILDDVIMYGNGDSIFTSKPAHDVTDGLNDVIKNDLHGMTPTCSHYAKTIVHDVITNSQDVVQNGVTAVITTNDIMTLNDVEMNTHDVTTSTSGNSVTQHDTTLTLLCVKSELASAITSSLTSSMTSSSAKYGGHKVAALKKSISAGFADDSAGKEQCPFSHEQGPIDDEHEAPSANQRSARQLRYDLFFSWPDYFCLI